MRGVSTVFRSLQLRDSKPGRTYMECSAIHRENQNPDGFPRSVRPFSVAASCTSCNFCIRPRIGTIFILNRSFRRDEDNPCRNFSHIMPSWGRNQPNSVLNTKSEYFEHNFGLRNETGCYGPNIKVSPFDDTKLSHFEHLSI